MQCCSPFTVHPFESCHTEPAPGIAHRLRQVWSSTNEAHYEATLSYSVAKNPQNTYMQVSCGLHSTRALPKAGNLLGRSLEGNHPRLTLSGKLVLRFHS